MVHTTFRTKKRKRKYAFRQFFLHISCKSSNYKIISWLCFYLWSLARDIVSDWVKSWNENNSLTSLSGHLTWDCWRLCRHLNLQWCVWRRGEYHNETGFVEKIKQFIQKAWWCCIDAKIFPKYGVMGQK